MARLICTMYWDNIDHSIVRAQKRVFTHLGFDIRQDNATGVQHGTWMDGVLASLTADDQVLFVDIDCFPLTADAVSKAFAAAEQGRVYGSAQTANHMPDAGLVYAAPSFLSFSVQTWLDLDRVSMTRTEEFDVGMGFTRAALDKGVPVETLLPTFVCCPKWPLGHIGAVGYGTFYGGEVFHLFQSRHNKSFEFGLHYVAECVSSDSPVDYLLLFSNMNSHITIFGDRLRSFPRNMRHYLSSVKRSLSRQARFL